MSVDDQYKLKALEVLYEGESTPAGNHVRWLLRLAKSLQRENKKLQQLQGGRG